MEWVHANDLSTANSKHAVLFHGLLLFSGVGGEQQETKSRSAKSKPSDHRNSHNSQPNKRSPQIVLCFHGYTSPLFSHLTRFTTHNQLAPPKTCDHKLAPSRIFFSNDETLIRLNTAENLELLVGGAFWEPPWNFKFSSTLINSSRLIATELEMCSSTKFLVNAKRSWKSHPHRSVPTSVFHIPPSLWTLVFSPSLAALFAVSLVPPALSNSPLAWLIQQPCRGSRREAVLESPSPRATRPGSHRFPCHLLVAFLHCCSFFVSFPLFFGLPASPFSFLSRLTRLSTASPI